MDDAELNNLAGQWIGAEEWWHKQAKPEPYNWIESIPRKPYQYPRRLVPGRSYIQYLFGEAG
jgi:hypothetical protein